MFKGIQDIMQKSDKSKSPKQDVSDKSSSEKPKSSDPNLWPVLSSNELLGAPQREKQIEPLMELMSLELSQYNELCKPVLRNVAEFCQELPFTKEGFHSHRGGSLDFALDRAYHTLSISRSYFLPTGSELIHLTYPQQLWAYMVFTASLMKDLGHVASSCDVQLYDKEKKHLAKWQPFTGSMVQQGVFYHHEFIEYDSEEIAANQDELHKKSTVLLAKQFLPTKGFEWLVSNAEVFATWMALLEGDEIRSGTFGPIFMRAEAISIKHFLSDLANVNLNVEIGKGHMADLVKKMGTLRNVNAKDPREVLARVIADFIHWMKHSIATEKIKIGDEELKFVENGGLLLTDDIFKAFVNESKGKYNNWKIVKESLTRFGVLRRGFNTQYLERGINKWHKGVILNNFHLLMPASINALVLRWLPFLQHGYIKMAGSINQQREVKYVSPDGQLVTQHKSTKQMSVKEKQLEQRIQQRIEQQTEGYSPGSKK